jgi:uncharacterized protein YhfF
MYLPPGPARPDPAELERWWQAARAALGAAAPAGPPDVRWIGLDDATTEEVLRLIVTGDKTGTYTLPWILEKTGQATPRAGDAIVFIDFRGWPRILVELTEVEPVRFGSISARHTALDGTPVRRLETWRALHTRYWTDLLRPFGLAVADDMPVLVERFRLLYPTA